MYVGLCHLSLVTGVRGYCMMQCYHLPVWSQMHDCVSSLLLTQPSQLTQREHFPSTSTQAGKAGLASRLVWPVPATHFCAVQITLVRKWYVYGAHIAPPRQVVSHPPPSHHKLIVTQLRRSIICICAIGAGRETARLVLQLHLNN